MYGWLQHFRSCIMVFISDVALTLVPALLLRVS
jgi:hypothetical protein